MDRYELVAKDSVIYVHGGERREIKAPTIVNQLNTLARELAAANAKIEKAPCQIGCDSQRQPKLGPGGVLVRMPCNCWKSEG